MNHSKNIVIWNIRGGNNDEFKRNFHELITSHHSCMMVLLETRMVNHDSIMHEFGFSNTIEVPPEGQSGGMVILYMQA